MSGCSRTWCPRRRSLPVWPLGTRREGNPNHPISRGALCARGHSSLLGLYNPDRFAGPMVREGGELRPISWEEAEAMLAERLQGAGSNVLMLTGSAPGSLGELFDDFVSAVGGTRVEHELLSEAPLREATRIAFGRNVVPAYDMERARMVLSFGADFMETWLSPVEYTRGFGRSGSVDDHGSNKAAMVFLGPRLSLTGQNADEWFPIRPGSEAAVALAMAHVIAREGGDAGPYQPVLEAYTPAVAAELSGVGADEIEDLALRFADQAPAVALGPGLSGHHGNATAANLAVLILNHVAGYVGRTVRVRNADLGAASQSYAEVREATRRMSADGVQVALVHGTNPAYGLPRDAGFVEAFGRVPFKVSFAECMDETAALADLILPDAHALESWGDSNPRPGVYALQQPVMERVPHFDSKQAGDVLLSVAARLGRDLGAATFYDFLRGRWERAYDTSMGSDGFEAFWSTGLKNGVVTIAEVEDQREILRAPDVALTFDLPEFTGGDLEFTLQVHPSSRLGDGTQANRPWLQELPDPVSKITWHSWLEMNRHTGESMGLRNGDVVRVESPHDAVEVPVWLYPGIREDVVALAMGGGHTDYGRFGTGKGVNAMALLPSLVEQPSGALVLQATRVQVTPTGRHRRLATIEGADTQENRPITPAVALAALGHAEADDHAEAEGEHHDELQELQAYGGFVPVATEGRAEDFPLPGSQYGDYDPDENPRWAMAIDLDKCTGCSACAVACQAENNVAWVGEDQVTMGRDHNWIRLERYYETVDATHAGPVDVRHLPMLCQHCGNAPCEPVCPVYASYHTPDGLNGQIYNRCVGTRYCANNCPYKVRVFNWYTYTGEEPAFDGMGYAPEPLNWQYNPDVTVRTNGVMEKCSFCVQRIRETENRARIEDRPVQDGEVVPACQQSCPAEAIVFGNVRDPNSRVARVVENERTYRVLDELINTQPAVHYLKKVTFHEVEAGEH